MRPLRLSIFARHSVRRILGRAGFFLLVALIFAYIVFPFYWLVVSSLKPPARFSTVEYWPSTLTLLNFSLVASDPRFRGALYTSIAISLGTLGLTLALGSLAAYAIGRLRFRGRRSLRALMLWTAAFPPFALLGGLYALAVDPCSILGGACPRLSAYDSRVGLMLANLVLTLPLAVWFLAAYFRDLPPELEDAAYVDGATPLQALYRIVLPISLPGLLGVGLLTFITAWNEFLFARSLTRPGGVLTVTTLIAGFGFDGAGALLTLAASVLVMLPVLLLAVVFQRQLSTGLLGYEPPEAPPGAPPGARRIGLPFAWPRLSGSAAVLLVVLVLGALVFAEFGRRALLYPYPLDYGEGPLLNQALLLARGEQIYHADLSTPPWTIANYPPLYMLLQAPLTVIFGPAYWYGRLISLLSTAAAAAFAGLIVATLSGDRLAGVAGGLVLLMVPYVGYWAALARIDCLALALSLGGLYCVVRWPERRGALAASVVLLAAAVYTRQSYGLAAPFAAFVWLLTLRPRRAVLWALWLAGLCLGLFAALNLLSGGGFFLNIVSANVNAYQPELLRTYLVDLAGQLPVLLLGSAGFVLLAGWFGVCSWRLLAPYWVGAAVSALTIGKIGSNVNYLLEFSAALSMATGALLAWQRSRPRLQQAMLLLLALQMLILLPPSRNHAFALRAMDDPRTPEALLGLVRGADGPVLADEAMGLLPLAGRRLELQPFEMTQLERAGRWDQRPLLYAIAQQQYATILIFRVPGYPLERERWTDDMLGVIELAYRRRATIGLTDVYVPRQ